VFVKEKEHEQDSVVKIQLGKRLEQVLLDKEEAYEELEQLQVFYLSQLYLCSALPYPPTPPVSAAPSKCSLIAILYHICASTLLHCAFHPHFTSTSSYHPPSLLTCTACIRSSCPLSRARCPTWTSGSLQPWRLLQPRSRGSRRAASQLSAAQHSTP
jgi:hypothetical protein